MRRSGSVLLAALALCLLSALPALATGTPAGTSISNQATVSFVVDATTINQNSNEVTVQVAEVLDATLLWQDSSNILAEADEAGKVATFLLTNTGNGTEAFALTVDNSLGGDQFNPDLSAIYLDANDNNQYDAGVDTLYTPGDNDPELAADTGISVFVINDVPAGVSDSDLGFSSLAAAATTGTGDPGTVFAGAGDGGINAVVGASGGDAADQATLQISSVAVDVVKSATVVDPFGGSEPMPTATITYSIAVTATGSGTAESVTVTDSVPQFTSYVDGSLQLDGIGLTDGADGDAGQVTGGDISVQLGNLQDNTRTVTFQVTID